MINIQPDRSIDISIKDGQLIPSNLISDVLALIGTTIGSPLESMINKIDLHAWYGNVYEPIPLGTILTEYIQSGIISLPNQNLLSTSIKDACQPLITVGRLKNIQVDMKNIENSLLLYIVLTLPNGEKLTLNLPIIRK